MTGPAAAESPRPAQAWAVACALFAPMAAVYVAHFAGVPDGSRGTGFLQYDQFYYLANAREHFDSGRFTLFYGLPFSPDYDTPRLYLHVHTLLLGVLQRVGGWDPGALYVAFGCVAGVVFLRIAIALYACIVPLGSAASWLGLVCFAWGGGAIALAGASLAPFTGDGLGQALFRLDPMGGLWFLNLGRNLYYPTECYYHALFLGTILLLSRGRHAAGLAVAALLSWSHPMTGAQVLASVLSWSLAERLLFRRGRFPGGLPLGAAALLALHFAYYFAILPTSAEHRAVQAQWTLAWTLPLGTLIAAYLPLAILLSVRVRSVARWRATFGDPRERLLGAWLVVSLGLANHELFLAEPIQPLHFTRGHVWAPLFLLSAPVLVKLFDRTLSWGSPLRRGLATGALLAFALADNATWFGRHAVEFATDQSRPWRSHMTAEARGVLERLADASLAGHLLITNAPWLGYWATVYTPLRSWRSHQYNTPDVATRSAELRRFFRTGVEPDRWQEVPIVVVWQRGDGARAWSGIAERAALEEAFASAHFRAYVRRPEDAAP